MSAPLFPGTPVLEKAEYDTVSAPKSTMEGSMQILNDIQTPHTKRGRASLDWWDEAIGLAHKAWELLSPKKGTPEELDNNSREGMKYLAHLCVHPSKCPHYDPDFHLFRVEVISYISEGLTDVVSDSEICSKAMHAVDTFFEKECTIEVALE